MTDKAESMWRRRGLAALMVIVLSPLMGLWMTSPAPAAASSSWNLLSISDSAPVHVSSGSLVGRRWYPTGSTGETIAFDLSGVAAAQRASILVTTRFPTNFFHTPPSGSLNQSAVDYVFESNAAPGGTLPTTGWTQIEAVVANSIRTQQTTMELDGAQWLRVRVTATTGPDFNMTTDVFSIGASGAIDDDWLFLGDSITFPLDEERLADAVRAIDPTRAVAATNAAVPGTLSYSADARFAEVLPDFPGRYVVLAYGTNDTPAPEISLEPAVQSVIAAGKVPVIPMIPWSEDHHAEVVVLNDSIIDLYDAYPEIVPGPDLYSVFEDRFDLFPPNDVHPNTQGRIVFREAWAQMIAALAPPMPPPTTTMPPPTTTVPPTTTTVPPTTTTTTTTVPPTTTTTTTVPPTSTTTTVPPTTTTTTTVPPTTTTTTAVPPTTTTTTTTVPAPTTTLPVVKPPVLSPLIRSIDELGESGRLAPAVRIGVVGRSAAVERLFIGPPVPSVHATAHDA